MLTLSRRRVGALIVIEQRIGLKDIIETGTSLNSQISAALLENIFEPNTPLHDGAVVIRGPRIMAAACILSLSDGKGISRELGKMCIRDRTRSVRPSSIMWTASGCRRKPCTPFCKKQRRTVP